jgi:hypothetical protein
MTFKQFIYYCAMCGGWAALLAWLLVRGLGIYSNENPLYRASLVGGMLGLLIGLALGTLDAILNSVGFQRVVRALVSLGVGLLGGLAGGLLGQKIKQAGLPSFLGWMLAGLVIGLAIAVFDLLRGLAEPQTMRQAVRKMVNGMIGGVLGGFIGGLPYEMLMKAVENAQDQGESFLGLQRSPAAIGLVVLGMCIGLLIGLAQVILKEAWVRVEVARRPGKELILNKAETSIGRQEGCDIGLFGENGVERVHAHILMEGNRYLLADAGTPGGTYINEQRVAGPTPLRNGDLIRVGSAVLRFGERQKRDHEPRAAARGARPAAAAPSPAASNNPFDFGS